MLERHADALEGLPGRKEFSNHSIFIGHILISSIWSEIYVHRYIDLSMKFTTACEKLTQMLSCLALVADVYKDGVKVAYNPTRERVQSSTSDSLVSP